MRRQLAFAALAVGAAAGFLLNPVMAQQNRGANRGTINSLAVQPGSGAGTFNFVVRGRNPCGTVQLHPGDGTVTTRTIQALPTTIVFTYERAGTYTARVEGAGNCDGAATAQVRVNAVASRPGTTGSAVGRGAMRFPEMDANRDGVITRAEWRGSARSFDVHDWNNDGVLSGDEVRTGAMRAPAGRGRQNTDYVEWSDARFRAIDRNGDGRIARAEWPYDVEDFFRLDRNRNNHVELSEFVLGEIDDDREDRFDFLDLNNDGRLTRAEWHGSLETFRWLDRNGDGVLSRAEVIGTDEVAEPRVVVTPPQSMNVSARTAWTDTGINVRAGDILVVNASGEIQVTPDSRDVAGPDGARGKAATRQAPMPDREIGALVARVGNSPPFFVGAATDTLRLPSAGRLYLGPNDDVLSDNRGQFRVTVSVVR